MSALSTEEHLLGAGLVALPRVNLLPPEIAEQRRFRSLQLGMGAAVLAAVIGMGALFVVTTGSVAEAGDQVEVAAAEQSRLTAENAEFRDVTAVYARAASAEQMLVAAMGSEVRYSRLLSDLSLSVPEQVWVTDAAFAQTAANPVAGAATTTAALGTVTLSGVAYQHDDVAVWLESLATQKSYATPYLQSSAEQLIGKKTFITWSTTVVLTPEALSGRYTSAGS